MSQPLVEILTSALTFIASYFGMVSCNPGRPDHRTSQTFPRWTTPMRTFGKWPRHVPSVSLSFSHGVILNWDSRLLVGDSDVRGSVDWSRVERVSRRSRSSMSHSPTFPVYPYSWAMNIMIERDKGVIASFGRMVPVTLVLTQSHSSESCFRVILQSHCSDSSIHSSDYSQRLIYFSMSMMFTSSRSSIVHYHNYHLKPSVLDRRRGRMLDVRGWWIGYKRKLTLVWVWTRARPSLNRLIRDVGFLIRLC